MLTTKNRHNRHILRFDYHEDKEELKAKSDRIIEFFNFDKNEFFLAEAKKNRLDISNVFHDNNTITDILVIKKDIGFNIFIKTYYLNKDSFNDLENVLKQGRETISVLKNNILDNKKLNVLKINDNLNIHPINIKNEKQTIKEERTDDNYSLKLIKKIEKYQIDNELSAFLLEREKLVYNYFQGRILYYDTRLSIDTNTELEALFEEVYDL